MLYGQKALSNILRNLSHKLILNVFTGCHLTIVSWNLRLDKLSVELLVLFIPVIVVIWIRISFFKISFLLLFFHALHLDLKESSSFSAIVDTTWFLLTFVTIGIYNCFRKFVLLAILRLLLGFSILCKIIGFIDNCSRMYLSLAGLHSFSLLFQVSVFVGNFCTLFFTLAGLSWLFLLSQVPEDDAKNGLR